MPRTRRWAVAAMAATLMVAEAGSTFAQDPPNPGAGQAAARGKAARKRATRKRPNQGKAPVGLIVPYPFPPALIIRQTPETHDEIRALLNMLRYN